MVASDHNAATMRDKLNLNTYILKEQRKTAYETAVETEFDEEELLENDEYVKSTISMFGERDIDGKFPEFTSMITYCMENYL